MFGCWERAAERGVRTVENPNLRSILFYGNARGNDASNKCYKNRTFKQYFRVTLASSAKNTLRHWAKNPFWVRKQRAPREESESGVAAHSLSKELQSEESVMPSAIFEWACERGESKRVGLLQVSESVFVGVGNMGDGRGICRRVKLYANSYVFFFLIYVRKIKHWLYLKQIVNKKPLMHRKKI